MIPLLIAGHGTADTEGAEQFRRFVKRVGTRVEVPVAGGFIELSPPPLAEAVSGLVDGGGRRLATVPLMLVAAGHAKGDIPAALARERQRHPGLSLAEAVADPDSTVLLVGRVSTDPDANAEVAKVARLLAETTDVAGVEYAFVSLAPPDTPVALERCRRLGARRVVVLPYFLFTGVLPQRVAAQALAFAGLDVAVAGVLGDCDELADVVVERYREALAGDIRMNCDTCLYRVALPHHEHRLGAAQAPHDHPHDLLGPE